MVATLYPKDVLAYNAKKRQRSTPTDDRRCRYQVRFWLDIAKDAEFAIAEQVAQLKETRAFTSTVRDALKLIFSLQRGRVEILEAMFPFIRQHYQKQFATTQPAGQGELEARIAKLEAMLNASTPPVMRPVVDDDDAALLGVRKAASDGKSALNFIDAAFSLQKLQ